MEIGAIKSVLNSTLKLMGKYQLAKDEFITLLAEATSIVNNTPMWSVSSEPDDPCPISPANLITLKDVPNPPLLESFSEADLLQQGKKRWRRAVYLAEQFWHRWKCHYLSQLHERKKWKTPNRSVHVGDVVLLKGKTKRNEWPLARVTEVMVSTDGLVRRVKVKLGSRDHSPASVLERSVRDLVLLIPGLA